MAAYRKAAGAGATAQRSARAVLSLAVLVVSFASRTAEAAGPEAEATTTGDASNPHGRASGAVPGLFQPPEDTEQEDPTVPPGTIQVDVRDPEDGAVPRETVNLGILVNSVAKGDSRKHVQATTDDRGRAVFSGLATASNTAYRVTVGYGGGLFAASPFQIPEGKAIHVVLHVYPVTHDMQDALVVVEAVVAAELRDDRVQFEQALTFYTLGRSAWQPDGLVLKLPPDMTAFNAQASMTDQGVDAVPGGAKLRGTYPPGQHAVQFRWQIPWTGEPEVHVDVGLPPHVAIARVVMPATAGVQLVAGGFPAAEPRRDSQGQSFLVTERRMRPDDAAISKVSIGLRGLPTPGPGRNVAAALASLGVVFGLVAAGRKRSSPKDGHSSLARQTLLDDLAELEEARQEGRVGPKTYEHARRELIDALALEISRGE